MADRSAEETGTDAIQGSQGELKPQQNALAKTTEPNHGTVSCSSPGPANENRNAPSTRRHAQIRPSSRSRRRAPLFVQLRGCSWPLKHPGQGWEKPQRRALSGGQRVRPQAEPLSLRPEAFSRSSSRVTWRYRSRFSDGLSAGPRAGIERKTGADQRVSGGGSAGRRMWLQSCRGSSIHGGRARVRRPSARPTNRRTTCGASGTAASCGDAM